MATNAHVIIVGGGLYGCLAAHLLLDAGHSVTLIDDARPEQASRCASFIVRSSWIDGFGPAGHLGLHTLVETFKPKGVRFLSLPAGTEVLGYQFNPHKILVESLVRERCEIVQGTVSAVVGDASVRALVEGRPKVYRGAAVYVAAGAWSRALLWNALPEMTIAAGSAFLFHGAVSENVLAVWAPYKQIKLINIGNHMVWGGDSTGLLPKSYTAERQQQSYERVHAQLMLHTKVDEAPRLLETRTGWRPVVKGAKAGVFFRVGSSRVWCGTGGGKMGMVLGAHAALQLRDAVEAL